MPGPGRPGPRCRLAVETDCNLDEMRWALIARGNFPGACPTLAGTEVVSDVTWEPLLRPIRQAFRNIEMTFAKP